MVMRNRDGKSRGDLAREYLENARQCASLVNAVELPRLGENTDPQKVVQIGILNALLAIAETQVPEEPGMRLA